MSHLELLQQQCREWPLQMVKVLMQEVSLCKLLNGQIATRPNTSKLNAYLLEQQSQNAFINHRVQAIF